MTRISHRDHKAKAAAPVSAHSNLHVTSSTGRLVGAIDVGRNLNEIDQQVRNITDQSLANIFELESDVP
jgi:hypothetical protein